MTVDEMTSTLERLGLDVLGSHGYEIQGQCPAHIERTGHADRNPSWYINADTGAHICFSCGWKGNLYSLIAYVTKVDYEKASEWLGSVDSLVSRFNGLQKVTKPKIEEPTHITGSMLRAFSTPPDYALNARGLSNTAVTTYGILWDERNRNWIIPIRDPHKDTLLGWQEKGFDHRYFNNKPAGVKKSETLFGYNENVFNWAVIVESPLDVVRLASIGIPGLATYGAMVSKAQFNLIRGLDKVIFAMDNDEAGRNSAKDLLAMCQEMGVESWFFNYGDLDVKDVGGMSKSEVLNGIEKARHMVRKDRAIH